MGKKIIFTLLILLTGLQSFADRGATLNFNGPNGEVAVVTEQVDADLNDVAELARSIPAGATTVVLTDQPGVLETVNQVAEKRNFDHPVVALPFGNLISRARESVRINKNKFGLFIATVATARDTYIWMLAQETCSQVIMAEIVNVAMYSTFSFPQNNYRNSYRWIDNKLIGSISRILPKLRMKNFDPVEYRKKATRATLFASMAVLGLATTVPRLLVTNIYDPTKAFMAEGLSKTGTAAIADTFSSIGWSELDGITNGDTHPVAKFALNIIINLRRIIFIGVAPMTHALEPAVYGWWALGAMAVNGIAGYFAIRNSEKFINMLEQSRFFRASFEKATAAKAFAARVLRRSTNSPDDSEIPGGVCAMLFAK